MKARLFLMAMASVALASCVSEDVSDVKQKDEKVKIAFETPVLYNNSESRAEVYGEIGSHTYDGSTTRYTYPREEDFVIYAIQHPGDFAGWVAGTPHEMNNTSISYDVSVDGWAPKNSQGKYYFWPEGQMSFAASSPAVLETNEGSTLPVRTYNANGLTITGFEINKDASKQYDLLYGNRTINHTSSDMNHAATYYSGIPIRFNHALSSIRFSIKNETDANVVLTEIKLYGVKYKGNFAENLVENTTDYTLSTNDPKWTLTNDLLIESEGYIGFQGKLTFPIEAQYVASLAASDIDENDEVEASNQLLLMPQDLTDEAIVKVSYTVNGHSHSKTAKLVEGFLKESDPESEELTEDHVNKWEMGKRYIYRLVYHSETAAKDKIYFSPSSKDWEDHGVVVIAL